MMKNRDVTCSTAGSYFAQMPVPGVTRGYQGLRTSFKSSVMNVSQVEACISVLCVVMKVSQVEALVYRCFMCCNESIAG